MSEIAAFDDMTMGILLSIDREKKKIEDQNERDGKEGNGNNGATVSFKYKDTDGSTVEFKDIPKEDLPDLLLYLYEGKYEKLKEIANDKKIKEEYGFDVWIDSKGFIQTNDIAVRTTPGDPNHYFPEPGEGTFIASFHAHIGLFGNPSSGDVVSTVYYGESFSGFILYTISKSMFSSMQCYNGDKSLSGKIIPGDIDNSILDQWKMQVSLNHRSLTFEETAENGINSIRYYFSNKKYLDKNYFIYYYMIKRK
jgi:hypothetical protein